MNFMQSVTMFLCLNRNPLYEFKITCWRPFFYDKKIIFCFIQTTPSFPIFLLIWANSFFKVAFTYCVVQWRGKERELVKMKAWWEFGKETRGLGVSKLISVRVWLIYGLVFW
jgi:hypothetical protein